MPDKRVLAGLVAQKKSPNNIAAELGVDPKTIRKWIAGYGMQTTHKRGRPFAIAGSDLAQVKALAAQGLGPYTVARRVLSDGRTVKRALARREPVVIASVLVARTGPSATALEYARPFGNYCDTQPNI